MAVDHLFALSMPAFVRAHFKNRFPGLADRPLRGVS